MTFTDGDLAVIDKLQFISNILLKKNKKKLEDILKGKSLIMESMVKTIPFKINDQIIIYLDKFYCMKRYFDEDG